MDSVKIQITSGRGPAECCLVVAKLTKMIVVEAKKNSIGAKLEQYEDGPEKGTMFSAVMSLRGANLDVFLEGWVGTILWVSRSPYRPLHKRKNWFSGITICDTTEAFKWDEKDVRFETATASGPGGQNVNKVESAVRAIHVPSGVQVLAMDSRSQLENKQNSLIRLKEKLEDQHRAARVRLQQSQWQEHNVLERGTPVRVIRTEL
ncbi:MAG: peptide chain release factor H [Chitinophagaceae bacterium]|nr:MAG: peptide chain release factor H [Chitinophagaceae bacterium]